MMNLKKTLCVFLSAAMLLLPLSACGNREESQLDTTIDESVDTATEITGYGKPDGSISPLFLSEGDKIAVISPSSLPSREQVEATVKGLREWGFEPVEGKYVAPEVRTMEQCMEDLLWALEDPEIRAIFCVRGGYGSTEVMDAMTEELIAASNRMIIGYSDISAYHSAWTVAGLPSIHACMSGTFTGLPEACAEAELRMMKGEIPSYECEAGELCRTGSAKGILIGGNLSTVSASVGTAYDSAAMGKPYVLFLEDVGENLMHIHRYLTVLKHAGVLDNAAGIVFGEWTELPADGDGNFGDDRGGKFESVADMISKQFLSDADIPVAFGFPAGHGNVNYPLLMGAEVTLTVTEDSFTLSWTE